MSETRSRSPVTGRRVAGLDALRGVAVLLVLLRHAFPNALGGAGIVGVVIFFGLSGYLITGLLLDQSAGGGRVRYKRFFANRARRLFPALLAMVAVYVAVGLLTNLIAGTTRSLLASAVLALTYLLDLPLYGEVSLGLGHLWTLAVEEQFYLMWPFVLAFILRRRLPARGLMAFAGLVFLVQIGTVAVLRHDPTTLYTLPTSWFSCLLAGSLVRYHRKRLSNSVVTRWPTAALAVTVLGVMCVPDLKDQVLTYVIGGPVIVAAALVLVLRTSTVISVSSWWVPLRALGMVSYAVYLWNYPIVNWIAGPDAYGEPTPWQGVVAGLLSVAVAVVSWFALERPISRHGRPRPPADVVARTSLDALATSPEAVVGRA